MVNPTLEINISKLSDMDIIFFNQSKYIFFFKRRIYRILNKSYIILMVFFKNGVSCVNQYWMIDKTGEASFFLEELSITKFFQFKSCFLYDLFYVLTVNF